LQPKLEVSESPDEKWTTTTIDGELRIWNRGKQNFFKNLSGNMLSRFSDCAFSPDGSYLAGKLLSGHVLIYPTVPLKKIDLSELKKKLPKLVQSLKIQNFPKSKFLRNSSKFCIDEPCRAW
tara:strand:+ start:2343 stop:2705 length:363 start_codon:yes stop_codon:yes gene_type:complete